MNPFSHSGPLLRRALRSPGAKARASEMQAHSLHWLSGRLSCLPPRLPAHSGKGAGPPAPVRTSLGQLRKAPCHPVPAVSLWTSWSLCSCWAAPDYREGAPQTAHLSHFHSKAEAFCWEGSAPSSTASIWNPDPECAHSTGLQKKRLVASWFQIPVLSHDAG